MKVKTKMKINIIENLPEFVRLLLVSTYSIIIFHSSKLIIIHQSKVEKTQNFLSYYNTITKITDA